MWHALMALTTLSCISCGICVAGVSTSSAVTVMLFSMPLYSCTNVSAYSATMLFSSSTFSAGTVNTAAHVRGMALRMFPPSHVARRASTLAMMSTAMRAMSLLALARPRPISSPECPPCRPSMRILTALSPGSTATSLYSISAVTSTPPAEPIIISPSSSVSRLSRISPSSSPSGRALAPTMDVSSSAVMSALIGPCTSVLSSMTAIMAATPIPLSAPRVVSVAYSQSPSIRVTIGSFTKSWFEAGVFCGTMSICACRITPLRFSIPGVAGFFITTLPAGSINASTPALAAKSRRACCTFSRCPEGRGTCVSRWKLRQMHSGCSVRISDMI